MEIETLELPGCVVLRPGDELDLLGHISLNEHVDELLRDGKKRLVIDMELVSCLSSSTSRVLLSIHEKASNAGGGLALAELRDGARAVLEATGTLGAFSIYETVNDAVAAMGTA